MLITGCDYHPGFQQIAFVETDTGEWSERRLEHREQTEQFYRQLREQNLISKQGNVLLRFLLVEAAQVTVRSHPEWRNKFFHLASGADGRSRK